MSTDRRRSALALATVVVVCLGVYSPVFAGRVLFFRDLAHWTYPARHFVRASLERGDLPFWNPDQGLGFAVLANPLYGLFYPPNALYLVGSLVHMVTWFNLLHLLWGAVGVFLLSRAFGCSPWGASAGGIAWGLGGYATSSFSAGVLLPAGAWMPWVALGFLGMQARARTGWRAALGGAARLALPVSMSFLLGEVFVASAGVLLGGAIGLVHWRVQGARAPGAGRRALAAAALGLVVAALVAGVVVIPAAAAASGTARGQRLPRELAEQGSFHPLRLLELVAPGAMGNPYSDYPAAAVIGDDAFPHEPLFFSAYAGVAALGLALCAFGRGRRAANGLGVVALVALLVAMGRHTPLHAILRTLIPPLAFMRYPEKHLAAVFCISSVLVGLGATRLVGGLGELPKRRVLLALLAPLTAWLIARASTGPWADVVAAGAWHAVVAGATLVATVAIGYRRRSYAPALLLLVVAVDLAWDVWRLHEFADPRAFAVRPTIVEQIEADRPGASPHPRLYRADAVAGAVAAHVRAADQGQSEVRWLHTLIPNTAATWGIAGLPGYDAAIPRDFATLWEEGRAGGRGPQLLRLLAVSHALLPSPPRPLGEDGRAGLQAVADPVPGARLYRVSDTLPRVYVAPSADVRADDAALGDLFSPESLAGAKVRLAAGSPQSGPGRGQREPCSVGSGSNQSLVATCRSEHGGHAVFVEQFDPGWTATVDGRPAPVLRANLVARAVPLPSGRHVVALRYQPPGLQTGLGCLALGLLGALILTGMGRQKSSPLPPIVSPERGPDS